MTAATWPRTLALPAWAVLTAAHPRLRADWRGRWAADLPPVHPGAIWLHGASVGELAACEALLPHLTPPVLLTADTDTGAARARALVQDRDGVVAAVRPVDHPWVLAPLWAEARPRAVVFVEGAWWPSLARLARDAGVPVIRAGARHGPRTGRWARRWWYGRWTAPCTVVLARDEAQAAWFAAAQRAPVWTCGDLKADRPLPPPVLRWARPFAVGASTRAGDEAMLLAARSALPEHQLLLAPRHPARFDEVAALLTRSGARWGRRSALEGRAVPADVDVVLLDRLGELAGALQGASVAYVGGTFDPALGGHSPAEAARAGVAVVAGPEVHADPEAFRRAGARVVKTRAEVPAALAARWGEGSAAPASGAGRRAARVIQDLAGAPAPESPPRPWAGIAARAWEVGARWRSRRAPGMRLEVPVIAVGSTNARGGGKTGTVRWAARALAERGHRVGIVVRGYRRRESGLRCSVDGADAAALGDEGALAAADGHLVAACPDRARAGRRLYAEGATAIILDDGLQQRRLAADVRLAVVDARFPRARGPMPAGEGRGPGIVPAGVHGVVVHHVGAHFPVPVLDTDAPVRVASRRPGPWYEAGRRSAAPEGPVALFAGIARPADALRSVGVAVARFRALADHQPIGEALAAELLAWADGLPLVCTDKDAVRLPASLRARVWWRGIEVTVPSPPPAWLLDVR